MLHHTLHTALSALLYRRGLTPHAPWQAGFSTELKPGTDYIPIGLVYSMGGKIPSCYLNVALINVLQRSEDPRVRALFEGRGPLAARLKAAASKVGFKLGNPMMDEEKEEGSWHQQVRNWWGRPSDGLQALTELRERRCTVVKEVPGPQPCGFCSWLG